MATTSNSTEPLRDPSRRPSTVRRWILMILGILLLFGLIVFIKYLFIQKQIASFKPPAPPVVTTLAAQAQDWRNQIDGVGGLRALHGTDLSTEAAGLVRSVRFRSGQSVAAGDVLVEINADAERAQLASLQAAADLARTNLARDRQQLAVAAVSQATVDADEADLRSKEALVEQQRALVEKKLIRAPFAGHAGITTVNPGQYLNPGDKIVSLQAIDTLYVDFTVPQRELPRVAVGADVTLAVDAWPQRQFEGKVNAINSVVDASTRNVQVEATVRNPKHELLPGMFAKVGLFVGGAQRVIVVPQSAVTYNPYGSTVFIADSGKDDKGNAVLKARQVFVTTGTTHGDQVAILSGVKEGETVVTSGQLKVKAGGPLTVDNKVQPLDDASPAPQEH